jgi:hypothetical protein
VINYWSIARLNPLASFPRERRSTTPNRMIAAGSRN